MDGYSIANIEWSDKVGGTKVTISKDGNFATLTFNQALLSQVSPGAAGRPIPAPAAPISNPGGVPNAHVPKLPANVPPELQQLIPSRESMQPRTRGMIQRSRERAGERVGLMQGRSSSCSYGLWAVPTDEVRVGPQRPLAKASLNLAAAQSSSEVSA